MRDVAAGRLLKRLELAVAAQDRGATAREELEAALAAAAALAGATWSADFAARLGDVLAAARRALSKEPAGMRTAAPKRTLREPPREPPGQVIPR